MTHYYINRCVISVLDAYSMLSGMLFQLNWNAVPTYLEQESILAITMRKLNSLTARVYLWDFGWWILSLLEHYHNKEIHHSGNEKRTLYWCLSHAIYSALHAFTKACRWHFANRKAFHSFPILAKLERNGRFVLLKLLRIKKVFIM